MKENQVIHLNKEKKELLSTILLQEKKETDLITKHQSNVADAIEGTVQEQAKKHAVALDSIVKQKEMEEKEKYTLKMNEFQKRLESTISKHQEEFNTLRETMSTKEKELMNVCSKHQTAENSISELKKMLEQNQQTLTSAKDKAKKEKEKQQTMAIALTKEMSEITKNAELTLIQKKGKKSNSYSGIRS